MPGHCLVRQLHGSHRHLDDVVVVGQRLDDDTDVLEVTGDQDIFERSTRRLEPTGMQVGDGRHLLHRNLLIR